MPKKGPLTQFLDDVDKGVVPKSGSIRLDIGSGDIVVYGKNRGEKEERQLRVFPAAELVKALFDRAGGFTVKEIKE